MGYLEKEDIIGHGALRAFLARSIKAKRHHAYLLAGAAHLGKDTVARALIADELNRPINEWADLAAHPDVRVISREEGDKNISIAQVREFINHFTSSSLYGGRKIGVICSAHDLSIEAANALLKTLEEPSGKALIVLVADSLERLPETVKSRCQLVRFLSVPGAMIEAGLIAAGADKKAAASAVAFSAGRPGLAVRHAKDATLREEHAKRAGSLAELVSRPISSRLQAAGEITIKAETQALNAYLDAWLAVLRDLLSAKTGNEQYVADAASFGRMRPYGERRSLAELIAALRKVSLGKRLLAENVNARLIFENIALSL
jgi:DNA polymerase III subunit delta'